VIFLDGKSLDEYADQDSKNAVEHLLAGMSLIDELDEDDLRAALKFAYIRGANDRVASLHHQDKLKKLGDLA